MSDARPAADLAPIAEEIDVPFTFGAQLEARASHPALGERPFLLQDDRVWSWRRYRDECVRVAHFLLRRLGPCSDDRPGHVAMMLDNHPELMALYGGCGVAGLTLFGINTGLRGDTLAGVIDQSRARLLVVDRRFAPEVARVAGR
ncbi:MAG: AMP-binding protein, partial [Myxococcota bacterium]|nr:AMP-binding protein [Myxococcota bacterium]